MWTMQWELSPLLPQSAEEGKMDSNDSEVVWWGLSFKNSGLLSPDTTSLGQNHKGGGSGWGFAFSYFIIIY